jgi:hypothetical protein
MTARILSATLGTVLLIAPLTFAQDQKPSPSKPAKSTENTADRQSNMSPDMQAAIAWERHTEAAAARQARIEAKHPTVTYNSANRSADDAESKAKDEKAPAAKKDK